MLLTIVGIAIIGVVIIVLLKEVKPSFALFASLAASILLLVVIISSIGDIISKFSLQLAALKVPTDLFYYMLKIIGISFIIEFVVDIAEEAGCSSIANKVKMVGKILLAAISLPVLFDLLELIMGLV